MFAHEWHGTQVIFLLSWGINWAGPSLHMSKNPDVSHNFPKD